MSSAVCGQQHTLVMTSDGRLFGWGDNKHGQLAADPVQHPSFPTPRQIEDIPLKLNPSCKLLSGWTHAAILTGNRYWPQHQTQLFII